MGWGCTKAWSLRMFRSLPLSSCPPFPEYVYLPTALQDMHASEIMCSIKRANYQQMHANEALGAHGASNELWTESVNSETR